MSVFRRSSRSSGSRPSRRLAAPLAAAVGLAGLGTVAPAIVPAVTPLLAPAAATTTAQVPLVPNGEVDAIAVDTGTGTQYLGGQFTRMDLGAQGLTVIDPTTTGHGAVDTAFPPVDGTINAVVSDGNGGWFVGGSFAHIGRDPINTPSPDSVATYARANLAHVNSDGTVDTGWVADTDAAVNALKLVDGVLYVGGEFTTIGDPNGAIETRTGLAALDPASGVVDSLLTPPFTGTVHAIAVKPSGTGVDGAQIFVGGDLNDGSPRYAAEILCDANAATCILDDANFNPPLNGVVYALAYASNSQNLYIGGAFTDVDNNPDFPHLARLDLTDYGALDTFWMPAPDGPVHTLAMSTDDLTVYAGGDFSDVNDNTTQVSRDNIAAFLQTDPGTPTSWDPGADDVVRAITPAFNGSSDDVYLAGDFSVAGGAGRDGVAMVPASSNSASAFDIPFVGGGTTAVAFDGTNLAVGGSFTSVTGPQRSHAAAIDASGNLTAWDPNVHGNVSALAYVGGDVLIGGTFDWVNSSGNTHLTNLALVDGTTGSVSGQLSANGAVNAITVRGPQIYVGGAFSTVTDGVTTQPRGKVARLTSTDWTFESWRGDVSGGDVHALAWSSSDLYLGGSFTSFVGDGSTAAQTRSHAASVNISTGALADWNPAPNNTVNAVTVGGSSQTVWLGGAFTTVGGSVARQYAAAVSNVSAWTGTAASNVRSWNPNPDGIVYALAHNGNPGSATVYLGGVFGHVGLNVPGAGLSPLARAGLAAVTAEGIGGARGWNRLTSSSTSVRAILVSGEVYVGGSFDVVPSYAVNIRNIGQLLGVMSSGAPFTFTGTDFGSVVVGNTSTLSIQVRNSSGSTVMTMMNVQLTGTGLSIMSDGCGQGQPLYVSAICTVTIEWNASSAGSLTNAYLSVNVASNAGGSPSATAITGTAIVGVPGPLTFSPDPVAFGTTRVGVSTSATVTVTNTGGYAATPSAITVAGAGVSRTGGTCSTSAPIAAAATCDVVLTWTPSVAGALNNASLTIAYPNGANASDALTLTGTATSNGGGSGGGGSSGGPGSTTPKPVPTKTPTSTPTPTATPTATPSATPTLTLTSIAGPVRAASGPVVSSTAPLVASGPAAARYADAPVVTATVNEVVRVRVAGLRPHSRFRMDIRVNGAWHVVGTMTTGARGRGTTPAIISDTAGSFPIRLRVTSSSRDLPSAPTRYVRLRVR